MDLQYFRRKRSRVLNFVFKQPQAQASLQSAFKMRVFEVFDAKGENISADELSAKTGAEKLLTGT